MPSTNIDVNTEWGADRRRSHELILLGLRMVAAAPGLSETDQRLLRLMLDEEEDEEDEEEDDGPSAEETAAYYNK